MIQVAKLELVRARPDLPFSFLVDGVPLLERFPLQDFDDAAEGDSFDEKLAGVFQKGFYTTRLGCGSIDWQTNALRQLLLIDPPELPTERRRLVTCHLCDCCHIACRVNAENGFVVWKDFIRGTATGQNAIESWLDGRWQRIECPPIASPAKIVNMHSDPIYFDERQYRELFNPLLKDLSSQATHG